MTSLEVLSKGQVYNVHRRQLHVGLQRLRGRAQLEEAGTAEAPGVADVAAFTVADADAVAVVVVAVKVRLQDLSHAARAEPGALRGVQPRPDVVVVERRLEKPRRRL